MKRILQWILGVLGAGLCVGGAVSFWLFRPTCPVPALPLLEFGLLGPTGLAVVAWGAAANSPWWGRATWAVCGALISLFFIGVWSFAPWALLALLAFGGVALLGGKLLRRTTLTNAGMLFLVASVNFALLFPVAKYSGIESVELPPGSLVTRAFPVVDYADAYRAPLPATAPQDIDSVTRAILQSLFLPCWSGQSSRAQVQALLQRTAFEPGRAGGDIKVYGRAANEILLGADEYHLDFRLSVLLSEENGVHWLTVSTIVRYNNWLGRAYFLPVRVGHQIILPHGVRTAVHRLR